jgi:hypothetical protein
LLASGNPSLRAWGVRAAGNFATADAAIREKVAELSSVESADILLQVAIVLDPISVWVEVLVNSGNDPLIV